MGRPKFRATRCAMPSGMALEPSGLLNCCSHPSCMHHIALWLNYLANVSQRVVCGVPWKRWKAHTNAGSNGYGRRGPKEYQHGNQSREKNARPATLSRGRKLGAIPTPGQCNACIAAITLSFPADWAQTGELVRVRLRSMTACLFSSIGLATIGPRNSRKVSVAQMVLCATTLETSQNPVSPANLASTIRPCLVGKRWVTTQDLYTRTRRDVIGICQRDLLPS